MVSCQKGPTRHAYAWLIGPFWQDTLELFWDDCSAIWKPYWTRTQDVSIHHSQALYGNATNFTWATTG